MVARNNKTQNRLLIYSLLSFTIWSFFSCGAPQQSNIATANENTVNSGYIEVKFPSFDIIHLGMPIEEVKNYMANTPGFTFLGDTNSHLNYEWEDENGATHFLSFGSFIPNSLDYISYNIDLKEGLSPLIYDYQYHLERLLEKAFGYDFDIHYDETRRTGVTWQTNEKYVNLSEGEDFVSLTIDYVYGP